MGNYILHKATDVFTFSLDWAFLARDTAIFPTTGSGVSEPVIHSIYFRTGKPLTKCALHNLFLQEIIKREHKEVQVNKL